MNLPVQKSRYTPMESAFYQPSLSCAPNQDEVITLCLGPPSKVIGKCFERHPSSGQCWGTMLGKWCNEKDTNLSCLKEYKNVCMQNIQAK